MKNLILTTLISVFILSACSNQTVENENIEIETAPEAEAKTETKDLSFDGPYYTSEEGWDAFVSKSMGIRFKYLKEPEYDQQSRIMEKDGKIILLANFEEDCEEKDCEYIDGMYFTELGEAFGIFEKSKEESIDDAILKLVSDEAENPEDCKVVKFDDGNRKTAKIESVEPIEVTEDEIKEMEDPFPEEIIERIIRNKKLRELCSDYAGDWSFPSGQYFIYDDENHKDIFIFAKESGMGMSWIAPSTIEFM
jgi:hypothetical protein